MLRGQVKVDELYRTPLHRWLPCGSIACSQWLHDQPSLSETSLKAVEMLEAEAAALAGRGLAGTAPVG